MMKNQRKSGEIMDELKKCPFCGNDAVLLANGETRCTKTGCPVASWGRSIPVEIWNIRPLEDALQDKIDDMKQKIEKLTENLDNAHMSVAQHMSKEAVWKGACEDMKKKLKYAIQDMERYSSTFKNDNEKYRDVLLGLRASIIILNRYFEEELKEGKWQEK